MRVLDTHDEDLRRLTHERHKVFAKFTAENCPTCEQLTKPFIQFSNDPTFADILFVRLNSEENPVAKQLMEERAAPFFVSYCQGQLLECDALFTEEEVKDMILRLSQYTPKAS
ncbi:thioredoxin family protein [Hymenobacter sp. DG25A]|uniref:thioredoxin family protein n=1 Tax=Hymenobacter sp. DG25A TaxID=1385663 RepID=UPI0006BC7C6A|nr:thioredoxin family protein [Hymenobacter sp. DG25A]ALD20738.1 hypothetical protein AM218_05265 [Hymenobacter sp. DG25A]